MIEQIITNRIIQSVVLTTFVCQVWKVLHKVIWEKKWDLGVFWATGGMPSSHTTLVVALTLSVGYAEGWLSTIFLVTLGFSLLFIRDAIGVRRTVDDLIKTVNNIIKHKKLEFDMIRKIAGHTPVQAFIGALIAAVITIAIHSI